MSENVYPSTLNGLAFNVKVTPIFKTNIQESRSGIERRAQIWTYPRRKFHLEYEYLLDDGLVTGDLQALCGFFLGQKGRYDDFLFKNPDDYQATNQALGTGDGVEKSFQLVRAWGGYTEPVLGVVDDPAPVIKLAGVTVDPGDYTINNYGLLTFDTEPGLGVAITGTFQFYYRCRFIEDVSEYNKFMDKLWDNKKVEFVSVKL